MSPRCCATLVALLGSLGLAVPAAWAVPDFGNARIDPVVFATSPGSTCSAQPPNSVTLPAATSTAGTITYSIQTFRGPGGLPDGVTFDANGRTLSGAPAALTVQPARDYFYIATDADGEVSLHFTIAVVDEKAILQTFYNETDGPNWWIRDGGWDNPITATCLGDLFGVTLTNGRVSALELLFNNLTGTIPPQLGKLSSLGALHLPNNQLRGPIPASLPTSLLSLDLFNNQLTGAIPKELGTLTNLAILYLFNNQLTGPIPKELGTLTNLTNLNLSNNQLTGAIPTKLTDPNDPASRVLALPPNLIYLSLDDNRLSGSIPTEIGQFTNLTQLHLHHNQLSGSIPAEIGRLTNLTQLHLHHNRLSGSIPTEIGQFTNLMQLHLHNNQLSGSIPAEIGQLTNLTHLYLSHNRLTAIPIEIGQLANLLTHLYLHHNRLTAIPTEIGQLTSLKWLTLDNNRLSGSIPAEIGQLTSLVFLSLYGNAGLYGYPTGLAAKDSLHVIAPGTGTAVCLPSTPGGSDCTIPTKVDQLRLALSPDQITATWQPQPADPAPSGYVVQYDAHNELWVDTNVMIAGTTATIPGLTPGDTYDVRVRTTDSSTTPWLWARVTLPEHAPPPPPPPPPTTGDGGGGGGGGGSRTPDDQHGDTPAAATRLNPRRYTTGVMQRTITAHLQSRRDVDYFTLELPYAGVLTAWTTGADTTGRLYQAQDEGDPLLVAEDTDSGIGANFRLGTAVAADTYYLAVSAGRGSGDYTLSVHYTPAFAENPGPDSPQSGVSVLSGWVCEAERVEIELVPESGPAQTWVPATGTSRLDTAVACGRRTTDTGYGLLYNWNLLGDGEHTVRVWVDDILVAERAITVTTLGEHPEQEFRTDLTATTEIPDFPAVGETTTLRWETARQNFMIASGEGGGTGQQLTPAQAWLGNPAPGSFQSGIGVISGWVCEAEVVEVEFETAAGTTFTEEAGYGTERGDTAFTPEGEAICGDTDNGFGLLFNWNLLGDGQHTVRAYADGEEFAHSTFTVTTLGEGFAEDLAQTHAIADFPAEGQTTTVEWQQGQQNFVIVDVE